MDSRTNGSSFRLEALVDFPDDALGAKQPIGPQHIDAMMQALKERGISRVSWADYGDCHGGYFLPAKGGGSDDWNNYAQTLALLESPLKVAVEAAHRHGLEIYAYFKPYETGPAYLLPEGSPEARSVGRLPHIGGRLTWLDRFVVDNPHLRIQRRGDDLQSNLGPIRAIKLFKKDDAPTRIKAEDIEIWASDLNYGYHRLDIALEFFDGVEAAERDVFDVSGALLTKRGEPVRVLTLSGFELQTPYALITTKFTDGAPDFENTAKAMVAAFHADGREVPLSVATAGTVWRSGVDFRENGLDHDYGFGDMCLHLDADNSNGKQGFVGIARGRNQYLPGALCETEPAVQEYWLSWVGELLDAGVDGIDFREENHSTHTDYPEDYGYNPAVIAACQGDASTANIARVRGDAYTDFLRLAKRLCERRGKAMRINFQLDWYRPKQPRYRALAYPANIDFQWQRWLEEDLCDEAILRFYSQPLNCVDEDEVALDVIAHCRSRGVPLVVNHYINLYSREELKENLSTRRGDGRFAGFVFYETNDFVEFIGDGDCVISGI